MKNKLNFNHTKRACYIAAFSQAIVCGFMPLLFVTFQRDYGIVLYLVTMLTTVNFVMQLFMDFVSLFFVDKVSYRVTIITAHGLVSAGMLILGLVVPAIEKVYAYPVILLAVLLFSAGGGIFHGKRTDSGIRNSGSEGISALHGGDAVSGSGEESPCRLLQRNLPE